MTLFSEQGKKDIATLLTAGGSTPSLKMILALTSYTPLVSHHFVSDMVASEPSGSGYARKTLATVATSLDTGNHWAVVTADPIVYTSVNAGSWGGGWVYRDTGADATSPLWCFLTLVPTVATTGATVTLTFGSPGVLLVN